jgi:hypothetical protein
VTAQSDISIAVQNWGGGLDPKDVDAFRSVGRKP